MDLLNRREIADGVFLSKITDSRFKQNRISFSFLTQLDEKNASVNAVVPKILTNSCRDFPDLKSLNAQLSALYAARLSETTSSLGDTQYIDISIKTVDNRYALEGEDILGEGLKILLGCLLEPLAENGAFKDKVTENEKQSCIDQIEAELNEKRVYAVKRAVDLMCAGEPGAVRDSGTVDGVNAVTPRSAYSAYKNLLSTARIEIICAGCNDFSGVEKSLVAAVSEIERGKTDDCHSKHSPVKPEVLTHTENMEVNQSKMVLGFKTAAADSDALTVMSKIYGGTATSKLFENVREKMSLCYYCWAKYYNNKGLILAECGVETENIEKAKNEILAQFDLMKTDGFTDDEISHAVLSLQNDLRIVNDTLSGVKLWYLSHIYRCDIITPEQAVERYSAVTRDRIVEAAKSVSLDTVYILDKNQLTEEA